MCVCEGIQDKWLAMDPVGLLRLDEHVCMFVVKAEETSLPTTSAHDSSPALPFPQLESAAVFRCHLGAHKKHLTAPREGTSLQKDS